MIIDLLAVSFLLLVIVVLSASVAALSVSTTRRTTVNMMIKNAARTFEPFDNQTGEIMRINRKWKIQKTSAVQNCSRCGQDHTMQFIKFSEPPYVDGIHWDYWGLCPITGEPVFLRDDSEVESNVTN